MPKKRSRTGFTPLSYMGVEATTPPQLVQLEMPPTENHTSFDLGTIWLDTSSDAVWMLTNLDTGVATWTQLDIAELTINTDSGSAEQVDGEIDILGSGVLSTSGATNVVTLALDNGTNGQVLVGGGSNAAWANITSSGGTITIAEGANTLNLEVVGGVTGSTTFDTDSGTATVAGTTITIAGGTNVNTSGASSTVTVNLDASPSVTDLTAAGTVTFGGLSEGVVQTNGAGVLSGTAGTNGQVLISSTGAAPAWASLTSSGATVVITEGANTINLESTAGLTSPYVFRYGVISIPSTGPVLSVASDNTTYWCAGGGTSTGYVRYSTDDGLTWASATLSGSAGTAKTGIHYGSDGYWVAVGESGGIGVGHHTTDPTVSWTAIGLGATGTPMSVNYNGAHWVATGNSNISWATDPTVAWTIVSTGLTELLNDSAYGNGVWVVVGENAFIATQATVPTGAWTQRTSGFVGPTPSIDGVAYSSALTLFCAVGENGQIATSPDGITWTQRSNIFKDSDEIEDITWDTTNAIFVAVGGGKIGISSDGINWVQDYKGFSDMNAVGFGNGEIVIGGDSETVKTSV